MTLRSRLLAATLFTLAAGVPARAQAQAAPCTGGYSVTLGIGGSLSGCFAGVLGALGEDAGLVSNQYYWAGNFGAPSGPMNIPAPAGTFMFDNNCGGNNGTFGFCTGGFAKTPSSITNLSGELVLGLEVPDNTYGNGLYWVYSGTSARNAIPAPIGFQSVLLQLTLNGVDDPGQFLFGWEDLNTGCTARAALGNNRYREEDLGNGPLLDTKLDDCTAITPGGNSDSDFNDSYMRFSITGTQVDITPEPMTMSLLAIGLVGLGGSSVRRRRKQ